MKREIEVAINAVREAARLCQAVQAEVFPDALKKEDRSPVTIADFGSQALICRALYEVFPGVSIVAEEDSVQLQKPENAAILQKLVDTVNTIRPYTDADDILSWLDWGKAAPDPGYFWTLDPIDGTKGFLRKDQYAIALALVSGGELSVSVLGCPSLSPEPAQTGTRGAVFAAIRGAGAYELPLQGNGDPRPIQVSEVAELTEIKFLESFESGHSSHEDSAAIAESLSVKAEPIRMDSQAKYGVVARGTGDAYLRLPKSAEYREKIWDHASGALLVREAGGRVTDIRGHELDFIRGQTLEHNAGIIATNGKVHDPILRAISDLGIA